MLFLDLADLALYFAVIFGDAIEFGHCCPGLFYASMAIGVSGRFREEEDSDAENERPYETNPHWYAPGARVGAGFGTKIDSVRSENARSDEKLVSTHECATYLPRPSFAGVHGYHN